MASHLQQLLLSAFTSHNISAVQREGEIIILDGLLQLKAWEIEHPTNSQVHIIEMQIAVHSPRLGSDPILESFTGFGSTHEEAESAAIIKFLLTSFHVLLEALTDHSCQECQSEWLEWQSKFFRWRVCSGSTLKESSNEGKGESLLQQYPMFYKGLETLFRSHAGNSSHWLSVFISSYEGSLQGVDIRLDNERWEQAEDLAVDWNWRLPIGYISLRHFSIALQIPY